MDKRHGSPYDRGDADAYYSRIRKPHYYKGIPGKSDYVSVHYMTDVDISEYDLGYTENPTGTKNV